MKGAGGRGSIAAGSIWKKAPPISDPAEKATKGINIRSRVLGFKSKVRLPINAIALINKPLIMIQVKTLNCIGITEQKGRWNA